MERPELRDLVEVPNGERLDVEYKAWLDLSDIEQKAKLARHMCALANHGGGYIIFGISDDLTSAGQPPANAGPYDQDAITGIIKRYLTPAFQVECWTARSSISNVEHKIIRVPSHGAVPICASRSGPSGPKGKPTGIAQGTYYTRAPGPESAPVATSEKWAPIIRRCVINERDGLIAGLLPVLRAPVLPSAAPEDSLLEWHKAARARFLPLADADPHSVQLATANYQFSYQIRTANSESLAGDLLLDELRRMAEEVHDLVNSGWSMFWIFNGLELGPSFVEENGLEVLECSLIGKTSSDLTLPDFWRISPIGQATIIRPYREDRRRIREDLAPGSWIWPLKMAQEITEVLRHARAFSQRFAAAETIDFRAEWIGLRDREVKDPNVPLLRWKGCKPIPNTRTVTRTIPVADLSLQWPSIVAEILSVVTRMFHPEYSVSSAQIEAWAKHFRN